MLTGYWIQTVVLLCLRYDPLFGHINIPIILMWRKWNGAMDRLMVRARQWSMAGCQTWHRLCNLSFLNGLLSLWCVCVCVWEAWQHVHTGYCGSLSFKYYALVVIDSSFRWAEVYFIKLPTSDFKIVALCKIFIWGSTACAGHGQRQLFHCSESRRLVEIGRFSSCVNESTTPSVWRHNWKFLAHAKIPHTFSQYFHIWWTLSTSWKLLNAMRQSSIRRQWEQSS